MLVSQTNKPISIQYKTWIREQEPHSTQKHKANITSKTTSLSKAFLLLFPREPPPACLPHILPRLLSHWHHQLHNILSPLQTSYSVSTIWALWSLSLWRGRWRWHPAVVLQHAWRSALWLAEHSTRLLWRESPTACCLWSTRLYRGLRFRRL